jgi:hypothetical protein
MAFQLIWATAPLREFPPVEMSLAFSGLTTDVFSRIDVTFDKPAQVQGVVVDLRPHGDFNIRPLHDFPTEMRSPDFEPHVINIDAQIRTHDALARFGLRNLLSNDTLHMMAVSPTLFLGNVYHGPRFFSAFATREPCIATCADGTSAQGCVTCTEGTITVKVCC